ncbi:protein of unknown function (plasmid) [Caballeronia sp. S22]
MTHPLDPRFDRIKKMSAQAWDIVALSRRADGTTAAAVRIPMLLVSVSVAIAGLEQDRLPGGRKAWLRATLIPCIESPLAIRFSFSLGPLIVARGPLSARPRI